MKTAYEGARRTIAWIADESGSYRGKEYFDDLGEADRAGFEALFERLGDAGVLKNREKFRHEEGGIYCFKRFQHRLFCFFDGQLVCITHGMRKKRDRVPRTELEKCNRMRDHHLKKKERS